MNETCGFYGFYYCEAIECYHYLGNFPVETASLMFCQLS